MRPPTTQGPVIFTATTAGPAAQVPVWRGALVAVGRDRTGPTPQMRAPGCADVKNSWSWMLPMPLNRVASGPGRLSIGRMVRTMAFQLVVSLNGITGWKFTVKEVVSLRSPPVLKLNWKGNETRSPIGFCDSFASAVTSCKGCCAVTVTAARHPYAAIDRMREDRRISAPVLHPLRQL